VSQSPIPESTNGVEHVKDSNTAECSGNQVLYLTLTYNTMHIYINTA
jgi:hypothetical protein